MPIHPPKANAARTIGLDARVRRYPTETPAGAKGERQCTNRPLVSVPQRMPVPSPALNAPLAYWSPNLDSVAPWDSYQLQLDGIRRAPPYPKYRAHHTEMPRNRSPVSGEVAQ
jgi:hypothetical protein